MVLFIFNAHMYLDTSCFWTYSILISHLGLNWGNDCCKTYEERANGHSIIKNVTNNPINTISSIKSAPVLNHRICEIIDLNQMKSLWQKEASHNLMGNQISHVQLAIFWVYSPHFQRHLHHLPGKLRPELLKILPHSGPVQHLPHANKVHCPNTKELALFIGRLNFIVLGGI